MSSTEIVKKTEVPGYLQKFAEAVEQHPQMPILRIGCGGSGAKGFFLKLRSESVECESIDLIPVGFWRSRKCWPRTFDEQQSEGAVVPPDCHALRVRFSGNRFDQRSDNTVPDETSENPQADLCRNCLRYPADLRLRSERFNVVCWSITHGCHAVIDAPLSLGLSFIFWAEDQTRVHLQEWAKTTFDQYIPGLCVNHIAWRVTVANEAPTKGAMARKVWKATLLRVASEQELSHITAHAAEWTSEAEGLVASVADGIDEDPAPETADPPSPPPDATLSWRAQAITHLTELGKIDKDDEPDAAKKKADDWLSREMGMKWQDAVLSKDAKVTERVKRTRKLLVETVPTFD